MLHTVLMFCEMSDSLSVMLPEEAFGFSFIFLTKQYVSWTEPVMARNKQTLKELIFRQRNSNV